MARIVHASILGLGILLFQTTPGLAGPPPTLADHCLTLPGKGLMAKAIEVLLDRQYVVQAADPSLGVIGFSKLVQSGNSNSKHVVKLAGTMLVTPQADGRALVRMLIQQEWMDLMANSVTGLGAEVDTDQNYYKELFADLAKGMSDVKPQP